MSLTVSVIPAPLAVSTAAPEPAAAGAATKADFAALLAQWNAVPSEDGAAQFTVGQLDIDALEQALLAASTPLATDTDVEVAPEESAEDVVQQMLGAMQQLELDVAEVQEVGVSADGEALTDAAPAAADTDQHAALAALMSMLQLSSEARPVPGARRADSNENLSLISPRARVRAAQPVELSPLRVSGAESLLTAAPAATDITPSASVILPLNQAIEVAGTESFMPQLQTVAISDQPRALQSFVPNAQANEATLPSSLLRLNEPLATSAWRGEFNQQVAQLALKQGDQRVLMQLHPAELGPLTVELRVRDGQADLQFLSPHLQVRSAVAEALPQLREALSQQGISLGQADVSEQQHGQQWQQEREAAPEGSFSLTAAATAQEPAATKTAKPAPSMAGRVNLYV